MAHVTLGMDVKDLITGFAGTVTGIATYISGCTQALVVPPLDKDGKMQVSEWFDIQRLSAASDKVVVLDNGATPGPDRAAPKR